MIHCNPKAEPCGASAWADGEWSNFGRVTDVSNMGPHSTRRPEKHHQLKKGWERLFFFAVGDRPEEQGSVLEKFQRLPTMSVSRAAQLRDKLGVC